MALVTGSTEGIGRAIAVKLAENGADIALNGRRPEKGEGVIREIGKLGRKAILERADINIWLEVKQMVAKVLSRLGKIDILVTSGGRPHHAPAFFHEFDPESYTDWVKSQWLNRLYCVRAVLDHMIERKWGKILMLTTDAGRWPTPGESLVGGSAAGLVLATKVLASELARWGIRINTISLTVTRDTPALEEILSSDSSAAKVFRKALERQPFPVYAKDVAEAALFLVSDDSNAITGQILSVNGGLCFPG